MKAESIEVPIKLSPSGTVATLEDFAKLVRDLKQMGRFEVCRAEALAALSDGNLDDATARKKAKDWLLHAYLA